MVIVVIQVLIYLGDSINYVGENRHNNGNFTRKFGPRDLMYYGEFY